MTLPNTVTVEDILPIMIELRKIARELKDYKAAGTLRDVFVLLGAEVADYKNGETRYYYNGKYYK